MNTNKKKWSYTLIAMLLLLVTAFCIQSTFAYFSDTDTIGSNSVNVPYVSATLKHNTKTLTKTGDFYSSTSVVGENNVTVDINTNFPVVVRILSTVLEDITYNSKFTFANDGYYYYNEIISSSTTSSLNLFTFTSTEANQFDFAIDIVQANYYGLGAMLGYVKDYTSETAVEDKPVIDFVNKTFTYNISKSSVGGKVVVVGYGKPLEEVTSSKTITITAYTNITFKIIINFTA